jgi:regulator of protease activity HflC (stomatin/prohibitin superfamily)|tara:strand:- start:48 stop:1040 length:993 start_codon:yes stop_codon:yes gene_type:complete
MDAMLVIVIVATLFVIIFVASGLKIIPQAETRIIERLGKYNRTLESGVNIIIPVFDKPRSIFWRYRVTDVSGDDIVTQRMTKKIDLREQVFDFPRQNVITKDNVTIEIDAMLYFQITDPVKSTYEIANLPNAIEKLTQTTLRNVLGELDLDECLVSRDIINTKLRAILDEATDKWGVKVNRVELQDITPPPEIQKAMEQQMRAERDRRASILEAEGKKKATILESEGVKESAINMAEGEKRSAILQAEGEAEARVKVATAEKEAIDRITEAISASKGDPANYLIAVRYIETLKEMVSGQNNKVVYLPYEATGVLSSIGGIKDMLSGVGKK